MAGYWYKVLILFWVPLYDNRTNATFLEIPQKQGSGTEYFGNNATLICKAVNKTTCLKLGSYGKRSGTPPAASFRGNL